MITSWPVHPSQRLFRNWKKILVYILTVYLLKKNNTTAILNKKGSESSHSGAKFILLGFSRQLQEAAFNLCTFSQVLSISTFQISLYWNKTNVFLILSCFMKTLYFLLLFLLLNKSWTLLAGCWHICLDYQIRFYSMSSHLTLMYCNCR